jgi:hypothetical protein
MFEYLSRQLRLMIECLILDHLDGHMDSDVNHIHRNIMTPLLTHTNQFVLHIPIVVDYVIFIHGKLENDVIKVSIQLLGGEGRISSQQIVYIGLQAAY